MNQNLPSSRLAVLASHLSTLPDVRILHRLHVLPRSSEMLNVRVYMPAVHAHQRDDVLFQESLDSSPCRADARRPAPGGGSGVLYITDARTGKKYEVCIPVPCAREVCHHDDDAYVRRLKSKVAGSI